MGKVLDLATLVDAVKPLWIRRVRGSGSRGVSLNLVASAGRFEVRMSAESVEVFQSDDASAHALEEGEFAHLLFRSFDLLAAERLGSQPNLDFLRALFSEHTFVVWRADAF